MPSRRCPARDAIMHHVVFVSLQHTLRVVSAYGQLAGIRYWLGWHPVPAAWKHTVGTPEALTNQSIRLLLL